MREAARPKPVNHRPRLIPIVADNEPTEQCPIVVGERCRCTFDRTAYPVRCDSNRTAFVDIARPVEVEFADDVLPRNSAGPLPIEFCALTTHRDPLPATPLADSKLPGSPSRPDLITLTVDVDNHAGARRVWLWIVHEPDPAFEVAELIGPKPIPRVIRTHRSSGREHDRQDDQDRRPERHRRGERQNDCDQRFACPHRHGNDDCQDHNTHVGQLQCRVP